MAQASVGFHCPECVQGAARNAPVYTTRNLPTDKPWATYTFMALCIAVFVACIATLGPGGDPVNNLNGRVVEEGILWGPLVGLGEWWRLVTSGFLHAGILHLGMNMYVLYSIGPQMERVLGHLRFAGLYLGALLAGSLGVMIVSPNAQTLGASGAIFGLLGAAAAYQWANGIDIRRSGLGMLILINVGFTVFFSGYLSVGGHFGGLIGGAALGYALVWLEQRKQPVAIGLLAAAVFMLGCAAAAIILAPAVTRLG